MIREIDHFLSSWEKTALPGDRSKRAKGFAGAGVTAAASETLGLLLHGRPPD
jgi:hypothetical protein